MRMVGEIQLLKSLASAFLGLLHELVLQKYYGKGCGFFLLPIKC